MTTAYRTHRVSLLDTFLGERYFEFCRAVLDYGEHLRHWYMRGSIGHSPFSPWADLPWDELQGLIAVNLDEPMASLAAARGVATVSVTPDHLNTRLPVVTSDFRAIGCMGAEHLMARGYAHFAYIGEDSWQSDLQHEGFSQTLAAAGRACLNRTIEKGDSDSISREVRGWLAAFAKPVGVMTVMDYVARFTANAAADLGLRMPGEVGVLGVNNNPWASIIAAVPISSVQVDERRLGRVAAEKLDRLMRGETVEPMKLIPPLRVVTRRSTDIVLNRDALVSGALQYIRDHVQEGITVEDVLADAGCSRSTLEKRLKAAVGHTVHHAITRARVEAVKQMLLNTDVSTEQIADRCGFECLPRLYEAFKRIAGTTPAAYRRSMRNAVPLQST